MARRFVGQLSNPGLHRQETIICEELDVEENLARPNLTPELLYMMLPGKCSFGNMEPQILTVTGPDRKTNSQGTIVWPDHISDRTLERMGLAIMERSESEQVLQLYRISVWIKAFSCISKLAPLISSEHLKAHFKRLKKQYEAGAIEELNAVPLTASPSLPLLQALLSGVSHYSQSIVHSNANTIIETADAVFRQHVPLLDVHSTGIQGHYCLKLS
jgi:hypothetical protein